MTAIRGMKPWLRRGQRLKVNEPGNAWFQAVQNALLKTEIRHATPLEMALFRDDPEENPVPFIARPNASGNGWEVVIPPVAVPDLFFMVDDASDDSNDRVIVRRGATQKAGYAIVVVAESAEIDILANTWIYSVYDLSSGDWSHHETHEGDNMPDPDDDEDLRPIAFVQYDGGIVGIVQAHTGVLREPSALPPLPEDEGWYGIIAKVDSEGDVEIAPSWTEVLVEPEPEP